MLDHVCLNYSNLFYNIIFKHYRCSFSHLYFKKIKFRNIIELYTLEYAVVYLLIVNEYESLSVYTSDIL